MLNELFSRKLSRVVNWVKPSGQFSMNFEGESETTLVFVCNKYTWEASPDFDDLGQLLSVVGSSVSHVSLIGGSHALHDTHVQFAWSGSRERLIEYPVIDLRLLKRRLQKFASVVFGSLDPFSMTDFIVIRLKGAEHTGWHPDVLLCPGPFQCLLWWRSLRTLLVSGPWLCPTWGRQDVGLTATLSCYSLNHRFVSAFGSLTYDNFV